MLLMISMMVFVLCYQAAHFRQPIAFALWPILAIFENLSFLEY